MLDRCIIEEGKPAPTTEYPTGVTVVEIWLWQIACLDGGLSPAGTKESGNKAFRRAVRDLLAMHRIGFGRTWFGSRTNEPPPPDRTDRDKTGQSPTLSEVQFRTDTDTPL